MDPVIFDYPVSALVIGGCGFIGFHIVRHFLLEAECTSISVISRNPSNNRLPGVLYHAGNITDAKTICALIEEIQPAIIVHAACPSATSASAETYENVTVQGTRNLLTAALQVNSVRAFIFTSSATMAAGSEHIDLGENVPLADTSPHSHPYAKTKAKADKLVLQANMARKDNKSVLRTACIRLPIVYGERDLLSIPGALAALQKGQTNFQLGDGSNQWDFTSVDNTATAHVLLAKALLSPNPALPKVDGEAFNITDGHRHLFWDFPRTIWKAAGYKEKEGKVWVIPTWLAVIMAAIMEWLYWIFTMGTKRPGLLGRQQVEYSCFTHTYSIKKAKERLGYTPVEDFDHEISKAVAWSLKEDGWSLKLMKHS